MNDWLSTISKRPPTQPQRLNKTTQGVRPPLPSTPAPVMMTESKGPSVSQSPVQVIDAVKQPQFQTLDQVNQAQAQGKTSGDRLIMDLAAKPMNDRKASLQAQIQQLQAELASLG
jgi:hypothetical protein